MSQQFYYQTQFITEIQGANHFQQYNIEILNYTSLNFARPDKSKDSHTAAMTAERRKLFDQLPNLNTNLHKKSSLKETKNIIPIILSADHDKDADVTQSDAHVRFVLEPEKLHVDTALHESDSKTRKHQLKQKLLRRVSAPTQGIDYYVKNLKHSNNSNFLGNGNNKRLHPYIPPVHIEIDESVEDEANNNHHHHHHHHHNHHDHNHNNNDNDINHHHHDHDHDHEHEHDHNDNDNDNDNDNNQNAYTASMSSSIASVSSIASHNPPSLSPCSSASSIGSVDLLSPVKQSNFPQPYAITKKSKEILNECQHSHSLPDIVNSNPYGDEPWSPAAMFLSNFAIPSIKQALPDDEGQQVGEYIIGKVIGRGGFSTVKEAYTMENLGGTMKTTAVKIVRNHSGSEDNENVQALLEREIAIWRRLDHQNIVSMLSVVENHYATFVFSEYCSGGTLLDYIKKHGKGEGKGLYEDDARNIFLEVAEGVRYLHNDVRLVHKDLKLDNILLDEDDTWKICDFGFTEFQNSVNGFNDILYNSIVGGSLAYCAPEQLRSPTPLKDPSVDVWSLGVVLFAMVTGQLPFSDSFEPRLQFKIINGRYDESLLDDSGVSDDLKDLLKGMFKTKPSGRLTISEVLEHRWCER